MPNKHASTMVLLAVLTFITAIVIIVGTLTWVLVDDHTERKFWLTGFMVAFEAVMIYLFYVHLKRLRPPRCSTCRS